MESSLNAEILQHFSSPQMDKTALIHLLQTIYKMPIPKAVPVLTILYQTIAHTRDILNGKGEYQNAYIQLFAWSQIFPELAKRALETFVLPNGAQSPYGSWKDIKYLCQYCRTQVKSTYHPLIQHSIQLMNQQLWMDSTQTETDNLSLVAKWVPREHSKYGWLFNLLAKDYFSSCYFEKATTPESYQRAEKKAKMNYRKLIANLNRRIDTVQIKQCANDWTKISPSKIPAITYQRQKNAFLNLKYGKVRTIKDDRVQCAFTFKSHLENSTTKEIFIPRGIHSHEECSIFFEMSTWERMVFLLQTERYQQMSDIITKYFTPTNLI